MHVSFGHSEDLDSEDAIEQVLDACAAGMGPAPPGAGILFAGIEHDFQALLGGIELRYPGLQLIGCTTHGELSSVGFAEDSVVLMLFSSDRVRFAAAVAEGVRADPDGAARRAAQDAVAAIDAPVRLCITVPEGLRVNTMGILHALHEALGPRIPVCGGLAGDQFRMERTYQFCNGRVYTDAVPVLLFGGPLRVSMGVAGGWEPVGGGHRVTRAEGTAILELDGQPPRDVWQKFVGSLNVRSTRNALAVYPDDPLTGTPSAEFYLASPSHINEDGHLILNQPISTGARIRFADATRETLVAGASVSAESARADYQDGVPDAALVFSCGSRHESLGTRIGTEYELLQAGVGADVPMIGFYTYGEFGPLKGSDRPHAHVYTLVTVLIGEEAPAEEQT